VIGKWNAKPWCARDERTTTGDWKGDTRERLNDTPLQTNLIMAQPRFIRRYCYDESRWALLPFVSFISLGTRRNRLSRISPIGFVRISVRRYLVSREKKKAVLLLHRIRNFDKRLMFSVQTNGLVGFACWLAKSINCHKVVFILVHAIG